MGRCDGQDGGEKDIGRCDARYNEGVVGHEEREFGRYTDQSLRVGCVAAAFLGAF